MAKKIMVSTITAKIVPMMNPTLRRRACAALGLLACPAFSDFLLNVCDTFLFIFSALFFNSLCVRLLLRLSPLITGHLPFLRTSVFPTDFGFSH